MLQCGIIGCGRIFPNHFVTLNQHPAIEIRWLCDLVLENTLPFAPSIPNVGTTRNAEDVFKDPAVDFVTILTDHASHYLLAKQALLAGKHVIVEKPFTIEPDHARDLVALANANRLTIICISQHRFDPMINQIRALVQQGKIGTLLQVNGRLLCGRSTAYYAESYWHGRSALDGGSALINQGYHILDIILSMAGVPVQLNAYAARRAHIDLIETEDTISLQCVFKDGALGSLNITSGYEKEEWKAEIEMVGTEGRIVFDLHSPHQPPVIDVQDVNLSEVMQTVTRTYQQVGIGYYGDLHDLQIKDFISSLIENRLPAFLPQNAVDTISVIHQAYASAQQNGFAWRSIS
jgi:UDP-N-acetyl-2-amino-2-deoxyglucuronate dehydrogenase